MTDLIVVPQTNQWYRLKALVLDSVSSPITKRVYNLDLGFRMFQSAIVVRAPAEKCRRGLVILLDANNLESCGSQVIKQ